MSYCDCDADAIVYGPVPERGPVTIRCAECEFEWHGFAAEGRVIIHPTPRPKEHQ